ncbi:bifunctional ribonuclease/(p)ppGpp synthase [Nocardioides koreensis]|uniref:Bifunctional ribonuclease/(P)ppGpp synthase n=1 Tax=Nocardioides koreensis TaxID=433651 RepID=A0ABP5L4J6_9ACTN
MHFVGVDLAWGQRKPTGLAVLDDGGQLVHVSAAGTDEEIVAALAPYVEGDCLVAIDAPLIVPNATGNRPAEAELNRDFARFDAGAHPANTGKPELAGTPRGARLCSMLGLDMNPRSGRQRRAIEVYPHPATVALFELGRTLKYKNKTGRSLEALRGELLVLMGLLEGLADADPRLAVNGAWKGLVTQVEDATRKSELRVVEDQVDAVLCAYIGLFALRKPELTTTYGDFSGGYIVTPTLPAGLTPTPRERRAASAADRVREAVRDYAAQHATLREAADQAVALVQTILDDAGINYLSVTGRAKSVASFATKAARTVDGVLAFPDPLRDITDVIGVRVITYVHSDVAAVAELLRDQVVLHDDRDMGRETASQGRFGYASRHLLIGLDAVRESQPAYELLRGRSAQVQIRTVLQHAWAEFEHDIRYKGTIPDEHVPDFDRRFTLAAGLLELADREFSTIRDRLQQGMTSTPAEPEDDDPRISPRELAAFLAGQYADAGWSRTDHYAWISGLLLELGITSLEELGEALRSIDTAALNERMGYRYPPGAVRRLDDALLAAYGERYVALHGNSHREPLLRTRLHKLEGES